MISNAPKARAIARSEVQAAAAPAWLIAGAFGTAALLLATSQAWAEGHETIIESHGYNFYAPLKYGPDMAHLDYVNPDAPVGGEIALSVDGTFDSMNPYATSKGSWGALSTIGYEDIMVSTSDEVGSLYCLLCTTIEYPESEDWVVFNIREDVFFSDGTPMTAEDILFTHELLMNEGTPSYAQYIQTVVASAETLDPYRIKFTFAEGIPRKGLISQMGTLPVWSKRWYEETGYGLNESRLDISPGTGEYMVDYEALDPPQRIIYRRNPDYWGKDHPLMIGRGNYDSIRIEYFTDSTSAFQSFTAGVTNIRRESDSIKWATAYDFPAVDEGWVVKEELAEGTPPTASGFMFNMRRDKFADRNVRLALGLMYNFTWTNETLQYGLFEQRESFWENDRLKASGLPEGEELALLEEFRDQLAPEIFTEPALLPHESGSSPLDRRNLRRALGLLQEAGYTPGSDGLLRNANGETLVVEFLEDTQSLDRIILPYIENLKTLGVDATYNRVDPSQYQSLRQTNAFDIRIDRYRSGLVEGAGLQQKFGCADRDDIFNPAGYCNPVVDILAERIQLVKTYDEMATIIRAIDRIMRHDYFVVPTWMVKKNWVAYYDMFEYPETLPEFGLGHLDYWWINPEKEAALKAAGALK